MGEEHSCSRVAHLEREGGSILKLREVIARKAVPECVGRPFLDSSSPLSSFAEFGGSTFPFGRANGASQVFRFG